MNDEYFMRIALEEAEKAFKKGEIPVGAVIVSNGEIVTRTYNTKEESGDPTAHAELMAIRDMSVRTGEWRLTEATLYVTKEPCVMCAGAMLNSRLNRLVFGCKDDRFGAVNSRYQLLHDPFMNHQVRVVSGVLEEECAALLKKFFSQRRNT